MKIEAKNDGSDKVGIDAWSFEMDLIGIRATEQSLRIRELEGLRNTWDGM